MYICRKRGTHRHTAAAAKRIQFCKSIIMWKFMHYVTMPIRIFNGKRKPLISSKNDDNDEGAIAHQEHIEIQFLNESTGFWHAGDGSDSFIFGWWYVCVCERAHSIIKKRNQIFCYIHPSEWITSALIINIATILFSPFNFHLNWRIQSLKDDKENNIVAIKNGLNTHTYQSDRW